MTIHYTMGTRVLCVTLDLPPVTLIAGFANTTSLHHGKSDKSFLAFIESDRACTNVGLDVHAHLSLSSPRNGLITSGAKTANKIQYPLNPLKLLKGEMTIIAAFLSYTLDLWFQPQDSNRF